MPDILGHLPLEDLTDEQLRYHKWRLRYLEHVMSSLPFGEYPRILREVHTAQRHVERELARRPPSGNTP